MWTFLSIPDLFNEDVADLSGGRDPEIAARFSDGYADALPAAPGWRPDGLNGTTGAYIDGLQTQFRMMQETAGEDLRAVLIAGDLLGGRWTSYPETIAAMFGTPGSTLADDIRLASDVHFAWLRTLFDEAGFDLLIPAIGDHDIGDNAWPVGTLRATNIDVFKEAFGAAFIDPLGLAAEWNGVSARAPAGTGRYDQGSYLYQLENVLFLNVDPFRWEGADVRLGPQGAVSADFDTEHLAWVGRVLAAAEGDTSVDHVIVQSHVPVLTPVNSRMSSQLSLKGGEESPFWQLLQEHGTNAGGKVRAYLNGEVHATTVTEDTDCGIVQISHGALMVADDTYYVTFDVHEDRLEAREYRIETADGAVDPVWVARGQRESTRDIVLSGPAQVGTLEIDVSSGRTDLSVTGSMTGATDRSGFRTFVGSEGNDAHLAHGLNSTLYGRGGNDTLDGAQGDDRIFGGAGDDLLIGFSGRDRLDGGAGFDTGRYFGLRDEYAVALTGFGAAVVTYLPAGESNVDTLNDVETLLFGPVNGSAPDRLLLSDVFGAASLSEAQLTALVDLYVAYFDRAPDAPGLFYWGTRLFEGMSLGDIAASFFVQDETRAVFPDPEDAEALVDAAYRNVLDRAPDAGGRAYWIEALEAGDVDEAEFMLAFLNGARAATGAAEDADILAQKSAIGLSYSAVNGLIDVEQARQVMALYDQTAPQESLAEARSRIDALAADARDPDGGTSFTLSLAGIGRDPFEIA